MRFARLIPIIAAGLIAGPALAQTRPPAPWDLSLGAQVFDPEGRALGHIVGVTPPRSDLPAFVTLEENGVTVALPATELSLVDGDLTADETREQVWGPQ